VVSRQALTAFLNHPGPIRELQGELAAGQVPDRNRPAHVQRVFVAQVLQRCGFGGDHRVEVEGVGHV